MPALTETEHYWNDQIIKAIEKISREYPELVKYLDEMPITMPDNTDPDINSRILKEFYESLIGFEKLAEAKTITLMH